MAFVLVALFLLVPIAELYVIVQVASGFGVLPTLALLVLVSIAGAWLVRQQGLGVLRRLQDQLARGELPTDELVDGGLILFAGALMLTPGFLTDAVGLLLLIPLTRMGARATLLRRFRRSIEAGLGGAAAGPGFATWGFSSGGGRGDVGEAVIVTDSRDAPPRSRPELGGDR